jgi:two-component system, NarL family, sensor histidine kinase BarA
VLFRSDLAKIEAGRAEVHIDQVAISDTCQTLLDLMKPLADKKQISLAGRIDKSLPLIHTDGGKVQQILYNLLSNAIKFTPSGGKVTLEASLRDARSESDRRELRIAVSDTGPGLPESEQSRIFDKFYQAERPLTKGAGGTGLGLAISKELTDLLGGRLTVSSAPGQGATFTFHLPLGSPKGEDRD